MDYKYLMVTGATSEQLEKEVNERLEEGYLPMGGPLLLHATLIQSMIHRSRVVDFISHGGTKHYPPLTMM